MVEAPVEAAPAAPADEPADEPTVAGAGSANLDPITAPGDPELVEVPEPVADARAEESVVTTIEQPAASAGEEPVEEPVPPPPTCLDEYVAAAPVQQALAEFFGSVQHAWRAQGDVPAWQMHAALGSGQLDWVDWIRALEGAEQTAIDPRFGAVEAFRAPDRATAAGVGWSRLAFFWSEIQRDGPHSWNEFYFHDDFLQEEFYRGRRLVGLLISTPAWAGDGDTKSVPRGLELPVDHPDNHWAAFARVMAERYRGWIDDWVIWNEPDIWDPSSPFHSWRGSDQEFYQLQKVGYLAIKRGNPDARVALPGLTYWWDARHGRTQYFERFLQMAERDPEAAANNWFFDAAVLHLYDEPEAVYQATMLYRQLMAARGISRPIWIGETNAVPWNDPANPLPQNDPRVTLDEQASYVIQAFAWALAAGAERISIYPFSDGDTPVGKEQMGLIRRDGSARPAYAALQTVARYLSGARAIRLERDQETVRVVLQRATGTVTVLWSTAPRPTCASVAATADSALLVDKYGAQRPIAAINGAYPLILEPAASIGGSPLLLLEP